MRLFSTAALVGLLGTSAHATGGMVCQTAGVQPIETAIVISHTVVPSVVSARLHDGLRAIPVHVAQSWLDAGELRLDLVDPNAIRRELRLRVKRTRGVYDGTLWRAGKQRWVRCRESE